MVPTSGQGPVNHSRTKTASPFDSFDNQIRYQDMVQKQMISQYANEKYVAQNMSAKEQRRILNDGNFRYGSNQNQQADFFRRQQYMKMMGAGSGISSAMADISGFSAVGAFTTAAGIGGVVGGLALPLLATLPAMHYVNKGANRELQRRKNIHSTAADMQYYQKSLGFDDFSYNQATSLSVGVNRQIDNDRGGFFDNDQQRRIHKIGLSNNMLSGRGPNGSASIKQYEKNFKELKQVTEEVVKLMNTTIEGGMSVIKELNQSGFKNIKQIRSQMMKADGFGSATGLGTQNMMHIANAGARAVQGTPWSAVSGANMYQSGAFVAGRMESSNPSRVRAVGGAANAAGIGGNFDMNVLSSNMGTKAVAAIIGKDNKIDDKLMNKFLSGEMSRHEIVTRSNQLGYRLGSDKVLFEDIKQDALNSIAENSPEALTQMSQVLFSKWGNGKYASKEAKAKVFSNMFSGTDDINTRRYNAARLLSHKDYPGQKAAMSVAYHKSLEVATPKYRGILSKAGGAAAAVIKAPIKAVGFVMSPLADVSAAGTDYIMDAMSGISKGLSPGKALENRYTEGLEKMYNTSGRTVDVQSYQADVDAYKKASRSIDVKTQDKPLTEKQLREIMADPEKRQLFIQTAATVSVSPNPKNALSIGDGSAQKLGFQRKMKHFNTNKDAVEFFRGATKQIRDATRSSIEDSKTNIVHGDTYYSRGVSKKSLREDSMGAEVLEGLVFNQNAAIRDKLNQETDDMLTAKRVKETVVTNQFNKYSQPSTHTYRKVTKESVREFKNMDVYVKGDAIATMENLANKIINQGTEGNELLTKENYRFLEDRFGVKGIKAVEKKIIDINNKNQAVIKGGKNVEVLSGNLNKMRNAKMTDGSIGLIADFMLDPSDEKRKALLESPTALLEYGNKVSGVQFGGNKTSKELITYFTNSKKQGATETRLERIKSNMAVYNDAIKKSAGGSKKSDVTIVDGSGKSKKERLTLEDLNAKAANLSREQAALEVEGAKALEKAAVASPVLNYWNSRWVL